MDNHHLTPEGVVSRPYGASKKEKYLLRKQQKEQERLRVARQKKIKKTVKISLPLLLIIIGIVWTSIYFSGEQKENPLGSMPKIEIVEPEYDAGIVSMSDGLFKHTYEIQNRGEGDLKIDRIWTSCHCTTARLKVGDKESPEFGMTSSPLFWSQKIASGETGYLEVVFDPAFHGSEGLGSAVRAVYLSTNDPQNKKVEVRLMANVVQ